MSCYGEEQPARAANPRLIAVLEWGLFLTLPIERVLVFDLLGFTIRPVYFFMAVFVLLRLRDIPRGLRAMPTVVLVVAAVLVSVTATYSARLSLGYALWASFVAVFALAAVGWLTTDPERVSRWLRVYVVTAGVWALVVLAQGIAAYAVEGLAHSWLGSVPRLHGLALEPSFLGFYLVPPLVLSLRVGVWPWGLVIAMALVGSTSRTGLLGGLVAGLVLLLVGDKKLRRGVLVGTAAAAVVFGLQAFASTTDFQPDVPTERRLPEDAGTFIYQGATGQRVDEARTGRPLSSGSRLESWSPAWDAFTDHPVRGVGIGAYGAAMHDRGIGLESPAQEVKTTNIWLEVAAEMGVLGLIALVVWGVAPIPGLWRRRREATFAVPVLAVLIASLAMFAFVQTWWVPYRWFPWVFAYAIASSMRVSPTAVNSAVSTGWRNDVGTKLWAARS